MRRSRSSVLLLGLAALFFAGLASARPGGGGSFSSHSGGGGFSHSSGGGFSHSGGGSSGAGSGGNEALGELLSIVFQLTVEFPRVMVPLWLGVVGLIVWNMSRSSRRREWASADASEIAVEPSPPEPRIEFDESVAALRQIDPDFSVIVFEDFLYALYAAVHAARDARRKAELAAYVAPAVTEVLDHLHRDAADVGEFVIGSMRLCPIQVTADADGRSWASVTADFEVNYTERNGDRDQSWWGTERWTLTRLGSARSRPPERARVFQCPNCGGALDGMKGTKCTYCGQVVATGQFDWLVSGISVDAREPRGPMLTANVAEQGTDLPTIVDSALGTRFAELRARDPAFDQNAFYARMQLIFGELQEAWSTRNWKQARPFLSDALFQMQLSWIEAYTKAHLKNVTANARITSLVPVKVVSDRWYDAITVRLYATSLDFTISDDGSLVAGSRSNERRYSEYWTLIRGVGVKGAARADKRCPGCGAKLAVTMAGACEYCRARVTCGEFDWVLSRIEQDEVYAG